MRKLIGIACVFTLVVFLSLKFNIDTSKPVIPEDSPILNAPALQGSYCRNLVGLINGGGTCYQNAVLQCLLNSPIFPDAASGDSRISLAIRNLYTSLMLGSIPRSTAELRDAMGGIWSGGQQQDSQEFLVALRDMQPPISRATEIQCDQVLKCSACGVVTVSDSTVCELGLSMTGPTDLKGLLEENAKEETVVSTCNACNHAEAGKTLVIKALPKMVVIQLKRFSFDQATMTAAKISTMIGCPLTDLDLSSADGAELYDLHATVEQSGGPEGGHYVAHVFDRLSSAWFAFDDSRVTPLDASQVVTPNTYILFYIAKN